MSYVVLLLFFLVFDVFSFVFRNYFLVAFGVGARVVYSFAAVVVALTLLLSAPSVELALYVLYTSE